MRIICPNCDAQYEVPASVIPSDGRDVECSNCGKTWFQHHPDYLSAQVIEDSAEERPDAAQDAAAETPSAGSEAAPDAEQTSKAPTEPAQSDRAEITPASQQGTVAEASAETPAPAAQDARSARPGAQLPDDTEPEPAELDIPRPPAAAAPKRRELDPRVAGILREEAKRESAARAAQTLEVQTDLNLDLSTPPPRPPRPPSTPIPAETTGTDRTLAEPSPPKPLIRQPTDSPDIAFSTPTTASVARRELLPDIEEINSTLRSKGDRDVAGDDLSADAPIRARRKRGFRRGFVLSIAVFATAVLAYVYAPDIETQVPQSAPYLEAYVAWVDAQRTALDHLVQHGLDWLNERAAATAG